MNLDDDTVDELPAPPRKEIPEADRELLELAARALGARFEEVDGEGYGNLHFPDGSVVNAWNSLQFGGDCLQLEVELDLNVCPNRETVDVFMTHGAYVAEKYSVHNGDKMKARLLASTKAAAEIGKQRA